MKIVQLDTFIANAGLRNYVFVRLTTDGGMTGIGEASLEWQEKAVEVLLHEWVKGRVVGVDPFDIESVVGGMIRDQYQGGATVMTAISSVEVAMWDLIGKACGQPVYRLLGGRAHERLRAYANGWYGGARSPEEYAAAAREVMSRGYCGLKFDPFATAWKTMDRPAMDEAEHRVAAVREAVGDEVEIMIEAHGRLGVGCAIEMGQRLERYRPAWYEEPVTPWSLDLLERVKSQVRIPIAAGERLYTLQDAERATRMGVMDVLQIDPSHCGGLLVSKKIAGMAEARDIVLSPHCSIGPVAFCAALHLDWATPNAGFQESFAEYDVPWRREMVHGWVPLQAGEYTLPEKPGLGIELDLSVCQRHPYRPESFPSLWDRKWQVYADKAWLAVEDQYELRLYDSEQGPAKLWKPVMPNTLLFDEEFGGFMGLIENFLQVIRGDEQPLVTGWDGHKAYELNAASHLSMARGEPVGLPLEPESADMECSRWLEDAGSR